MLNGAEYEFHHQAPEFMKAGGTKKQVEALRRPETCVRNELLFDASERAAIRLTMEMTCTVQLSDTTFAAVHATLENNQHMVELVGVIATYNMASRFLVALDIEPE